MDFVQFNIILGFGGFMFYVGRATVFERMSYARREFRKDVSEFEEV